MSAPNTPATITKPRKNTARVAGRRALPKQPERDERIVEALIRRERSRRSGELGSRAERLPWPRWSQKNISRTANPKCSSATSTDQIVAKPFIETTLLTSPS